MSKDESLYIFLMTMAFFILVYKLVSLLFKEPLVAEEERCPREKLRHARKARNKKINWRLRVPRAGSSAQRRHVKNVKSERKERSRKFESTLTKKANFVLPPPKYSEVVKDVKSKIEENAVTNVDCGSLCDMIEVEPLSKPISATELHNVRQGKAETTPGMCQRGEDDSKQDPRSSLTTPDMSITPIPKENNKPMEADVTKSCPVSTSKEVLSKKDGLYVRRPDDHMPFESLCSVDNRDLNKDHIIRLLRGKQKGGTYLIRSGQGNVKVLAYLTAGGRVREHKIYSLDGKVYLKKNLIFATMDDLLRHYTFNSPLPCSNGAFLKFGYNAAI